MNAALVDDLESDLRILENLLKEYFSLQGLEFHGSFFLSGEQFLSAFCPGRFDMIFMDNLMDGINGMETARRLRRLDGTIPIIFVTTEESYALDIRSGLRIISSNRFQRNGSLPPWTI